MPPSSFFGLVSLPDRFGAIECSAIRIHGAMFSPSRKKDSRIFSGNRGSTFSSFVLSLFAPLGSLSTSSQHLQAVSIESPPNQPPSPSLPRLDPRFINNALCHAPHLRFPGRRTPDPSREATSGMYGPQANEPVCFRRRDEKSRPFEDCKRFGSLYLLCQGTPES